MRFTVATYNIHKGFAGFMKRVVIHELRERLHGLDADIVFLQEVQGLNDRHAGRYRNWPAKPQHEYIADSNWQEVAYGKNAIYRDGHHGNALLSRFSIVAQDNEDISAHPFEIARPAALRRQPRPEGAEAALRQRAPRPVRARTPVAGARAVRAHP